jgi:hypothetical protein
MKVSAPMHVDAFYTTGAAECLPHLLAAGALSESEQVAVVHLVRSIMAQTPPNMEASRAMPPHALSADHPVAAMGISRAFTNIIAALALDPRPPHAGDKPGQASAAYTPSEQSASDDDDKASHVLPGLLCSAVTAELVPLLQPIIFSSLPDRVLGSTAGLSQEVETQLRFLRPVVNG